MKSIYLFAGLTVLPFFSPALTLDEAVQGALQNSPELRAARAEARASGEEVKAALFWQNPELEFEAEGLGGDHRGTGASEYSLRLSQEFPVSGKNRKSGTVQTHAAEAARFAAAETGLEVALAIRRAVIDQSAAEELASARERQLALAEEFLQAVLRRHEAGAASALEVLRAEMLRETLRADVTAAHSQKETARRKTEALSGLKPGELLRFDFFASLESPGPISLHQAHPALRRLDAIEDQSAAEVALARSAAIPDITLGAGMRYEKEGDIQSFIFSVSVPLPLFNRGRSEGIAAAFRMEKARAEREHIQRELTLELAELQAGFETAAAEASRFHTVLLPKAEQAVELVREGYVAGRYSWQETVEVQQTLTEVLIGRIHAQHSALRAQAGLLKLTSGEDR
jgi:cobalt-zinc-cadmium efflux system outer membrane protein